MRCRKFMLLQKNRAKVTILYRSAMCAPVNKAQPSLAYILQIPRHKPYADLPHLQKSAVLAENSAVLVKFSASTADFRPPHTEKSRIVTRY